jgi:Kef-type K+ transport system membrane component KefB
MNSPVSAHTENILLIVIVQLIVIISASRIFGALFRKIGQPQVCGEIAAGLILGPSLFGGLFPDLFHRVFDPSVGGIFGIMSQIGLVLLMFLIGLEFDFGHLSDNRTLALSVSFAGILLPFGLGFALGRYMHTALALPGSWLNFSLFMATAMSITAIPILGRIMIELNINRTRLGSVTISAAAVDDATGWIILALVSSIARSNFNLIRFGGMVVAVVAFALLMMFVWRATMAPCRSTRWQGCSS